MPDCACFQFAPDDPFCARLGLGAAALRYAGMGYAVLPLVRGGKRPHQMLGRHGGVHHATTNPDQIAQWWQQDRTANIGVATGSVSRLAVIDLDVKHGTDGARAFWQFQQQYGVGIPPSPLAQTPSGGWHSWLRTPDGLAVPERPGILPGVDVKGDGGYVAAAPSALLIQPMQRPGDHGTPGEVPVPYAWFGGDCPHTAPPAPGWFHDWLATAPPAGTPQPGHEDLPGGGMPGADELARTGIAPGYRNRTMYVLACSLFRKIGTDPVSAQAVMDRLRAVWDATDTAGFPWQEVLTIAESARRFIARSVAQDTERTRSYLEYRSPWQNQK